MLAKEERRREVEKEKKTIKKLERKVKRRQTDCKKVNSSSIRNLFCGILTNQMDSSNKRKSVTPSKSRLARTFARVLHIRAATGITPVDGLQKPKSAAETPISEEFKTQKPKSSEISATRETKISQKAKSEEFIIRESSKLRHKLMIGEDSYEDGHLEQQPKVDSQTKDKHKKNKKALATEAFVAKVFASISSIKAAYAQLQLAQSPYDEVGIQASDREVVSQLKTLSELKRCYVKKQLNDPFPEETLISSEIQELKSVSKTYEITCRKLEAQAQFKNSEITFLKQKLEERKKSNKLIEKRLNSSGQLSSSVPDNLHLSGLSPTHFIPVLRHGVRSIRTFVKHLIGEMHSSGWDMDGAVGAIQPGVKYLKADHKCFAFESFVCRMMFDCFQHPNFSLPNESVPDPKHRRRLFFERFLELKSVRVEDYLLQKPKSTFGKYCRTKYLKLVHPKMELSFFGEEVNLRSRLSAGEYPVESEFFVAYAEMAKWVWLLHCLAFSFEVPAMIFQIKKNCRFSEVFMESVADEHLVDDGSGDSPGNELSVAFSVVPGFKMGKTVVQSQVYLSRS